MTDRAMTDQATPAEIAEMLARDLADHLNAMTWLETLAAFPGDPDDVRAFRRVVMASANGRPDPTGQLRAMLSEGAE